MGLRFYFYTDEGHLADWRRFAFRNVPYADVMSLWPNNADRNSFTALNDARGWLRTAKTYT